MDIDVGQLAKERTEWALERTLLANERTFSAWLRTGLAAVLVGLGVARLLRFGPWQWVADVIDAILILMLWGSFHRVLAPSPRPLQAD